MDTYQLADIPISPMHPVVADSPVARELERARAPVEFKRCVVP
jgi:predicted kinase